MMSESLSDQVLSILSRASRPMSALELAHGVGLKTRQQINPTLYELRRKCKVQKVGEVPAMWSLSKGSAPGQCEQKIVHSSTAAQDPVGGVEGQILAFLSREAKACTALEIAKQTGYTTRKEVNPYLYAMARDNLIVRDDSKGAPQWSIVRSNQHQENYIASGSFIPSQAMQHTSVDLSDIPIDDIRGRLLAVLGSNPDASYTTLDLLRLCECGLGRQDIATHLEKLREDVRVKGTPSFPVQWSIVQFPLLTSSNEGSTPISMETENPSFESQVLAVLEAKAATGQTALEIAKNIRMDATRSQVNSVLEILKKEGKVRTLGTEPEQWVIVTLQQVNSGRSACGINDLTRNPVSVLSEYCQSKQQLLTFPVIEERGPPHHKTFVIAATFGSYQFKAESSNKKEAKRMAADLALQSIWASSSITPLPTQVAMSDSQPVSFCDHIHTLSHSTFLQLQRSIQTPQPGRKVIAAFIMEDTDANDMKVVSVGSGTQCIGGDKTSPKGLAVNDSHAEVVARRSLMRFLYQELLEKLNGKSTVFVDSDSVGLAEVRKNLKFHLYISTAPCGDGGLFSRDDDLNRAPPSDGTHIPTMQNKKQGVLRTKIEGGEGTIPVGESRQQTWDGILHGARILTMSCSDKILRWNVLGLQGALLSQFMEPIYMSSLTLGSLHHHGHLSRAICCRATDIECNLPPSFTLNHPTLGRAEGGDAMERHTDKTSPLCLNWALGDERAELTEGVTGRLETGSGVPRITKASLFSLFALLFMKTSGSIPTTTYSDAKSNSLAYQQAKVALWKFLHTKGYGMWVKKPDELDQFKIQDIPKPSTK